MYRRVVLGVLALSLEANRPQFQTVSRQTESLKEPTQRERAREREVSGGEGCT